MSFNGDMMIMEVKIVLTLNKKNLWKYGKELRYISFILYICSLSATHNCSLYCWVKRSSGENFSGEELKYDSTLTMVNKFKKETKKWKISKDLNPLKKEQNEILELKTITQTRNKRMEKDTPFKC